MEYRKMGKWGVRLSCLGFGSYLNLGHKSDQESSKKMVTAAYENGINFFDTADAYGVPDENGIKGQAEELLGKLLKPFRRSSLFVISKVFFGMGHWPNDKGLSAKHIKEGCEASLKRLQMDYLDVLMCHRPDPDTPLEETVRAMDDLIRQGKILYWGTSQWSPEQLVKANAVAGALGAQTIGVNEPSYNLLYRSPEQGVFQTTAQEGIGNVTYSPLANGLLSGKYLPGKPVPKGSRAAESDINSYMMTTYFNEENLEKAKQFKQIAEEMGVTAPLLAIAWCLRRAEVTSVIIGARKPEQLEENLKAVDVKIPEEKAIKLDALFPNP
jgi:voltage-dependent potassium channel beta subunit